MLNGLSKFYNEFIAKPADLDIIRETNGGYAPVKARGCNNKKKLTIQETVAEFNPKFGIEFKIKR